MPRPLRWPAVGHTFAADPALPDLVRHGPICAGATDRQEKQVSLRWTRRASPLLPLLLLSRWGIDGQARNRYCGEDGNQAARPRDMARGRQKRRRRQPWPMGHPGPLWTLGGLQALGRMLATRAARVPRMHNACVSASPRPLCCSSWPSSSPACWLTEPPPCSPRFPRFPRLATPFGLSPWPCASCPGYVTLCLRVRAAGVLAHFISFLIHFLHPWPGSFSHRVTAFDVTHCTPRAM